jgi:hypothetical protein
VVTATTTRTTQILCTGSKAKNIIPNFPHKGVLVIDNASYHNVAITRDPTAATLKKDMWWLVERNIPHNSNLTKPELYEIIKRHKNKNLQYVGQ